MKIGMTELLVIFIVALVVIGPDKLPAYAKKLGEALKQFKEISSEATKDIRESIVEPLEEAQRPLKEAMEPLTDLEKSINKDLKDLNKSISDIGKTSSPAKEKEASQDPVPADTAASHGERTISYPFLWIIRRLLISQGIPTRL